MRIKLTDALALFETQAADGALSTTDHTQRKTWASQYSREGIVDVPDEWLPADRSAWPPEVDAPHVDLPRGGPIVEGTCAALALQIVAALTTLVGFVTAALIYDGYDAWPSTMVVIGTVGTAAGLFGLSAVVRLLQNVVLALRHSDRPHIVESKAL